MVAVLAVLKSGGAYLPLDPRYPADRLAFMLADGAVRVLITQNSLRGLVSFPAEQTLCMDESIPNSATGGCAEVDERADSLAYVIYTSGSTGKPKGVALGRAALANLILWQMTVSAAKVGTRTLQYTPLSFDVHFQELFGAWATGGALVLVPEEIRLDPVRLLAFLETERIERLFLPFIALQSIAEAARARGQVPRGLREVITAGEQLQITPDIRYLFTNLPHCTLHNHYGPSETHVVTAYTLAGPPATWPELPPIGTPLPGVALHLMDADVKEAAANKPGELFISGVALAEGYHGRPELTAERFVERAGLRMYRTGDLVRRRADGNYEYLGRVDGQVKIRGHRVEPGEIEVALNAHPAVRQAAVAVHELSAGVKQLAAYVSPRPNTAVNLTELRGFLAARLPEHMVPAYFMQLADIPLTPSGKVDRRALPAPRGTRPELAQEYSAPRPGLEGTLAGIWQAVLQLDRVGVNDPFFELGGNSLLCAQMLTQLREKTGFEFSLANFFRFPTIRGLVKSLAGSEPAAARTAPEEPQRPRRVELPWWEWRAVSRVRGTSGSCGGTCAPAAKPSLFSRGAELDKGIPAEQLENPAYVKARGILEGVADFDAGFFGINPREAQLMDPQQRLFLETAWETLENAGHVPGQFAGSIGVYAGAHNNTYFPALVARRPDLSAQLGDFQVMLANEKDYLATRTAYALDLHGPALSIYTACSTSLVAVVQAVHALLAHQCDLALAGGVTVVCPQETGYLRKMAACCRPTAIAGLSTPLRKGRCSATASA